MQLYSFFRSSSAYRVRIGLNLKGLDYELVPVRLIDGEQHGEAYRALNPQGLVPLLVDGDVRIAQSLAILEYVDERWPEPALLPREAAARARVRGLALQVACDIQPLQALRVDRHLARAFGADGDAQAAWRRHWIELGLAALEAQVGDGPFCDGDRPGLADCFLVPQVYNARRLGVDVGAWPRIAAIVAACEALPAFRRAAPEAQPDATG